VAGFRRGAGRGRCLACHNYRYKRKRAGHDAVAGPPKPRAICFTRMSIFSSPPVGHDSVAWLRNERARPAPCSSTTHCTFVDLACMFRGARTRPWTLGTVRHEINSLGQTSLIQGTAMSQYSVAFVLRHGFAPRPRAIAIYVPELLGDARVLPGKRSPPHMAHDNAWLVQTGKRRRWPARRGRKVLDKLTGRDSDLSAPRAVFAIASEGQGGGGPRASRWRGYHRSIICCFPWAAPVYGDQSV